MVRLISFPSRYGRPCWAIWTSTHSIDRRFHIDPAVNSKTTTNVMAQKAMGRIRLQFQRLRATVADFSSVACWNVWSFEVASQPPRQIDLVVTDLP
jgi:hypothetical protein